MIESKKWIIEIQNDSGEYAPYGWWKNDGKIHPYEYESKQAAFRVALNDLPKDCGNCRIVEKEQEGQIHDLHHHRRFRTSTRDAGREKGRVSMRLIDADLYVQIMEETINRTFKNEETLRLTMIGVIKRSIELFPKFEGNLPANWTPCSVALPEAGKQVLVTAQWGDEEPEVFSADMNPITDAWEHSDGEEISRAYIVIAWQPLPEPYRGEA